MEKIYAKKKYGQNFLKNSKVLESIASSVQVLENDLIIEIGPGMGALTKYLFQKKCFLLGYEVDTRMHPYIDIYNTERSSIIFDDFLKRNVLEDLKHFDYNHIYVVANIPYYITSPIITKLVSFEQPIEEIVLLVQKEFAERIVATCNHKEYNAFTLFVRYAYDAEILFSVNRNNFTPVPNVDSAVIKLTRKKAIQVKNKEFYFQFIKDAFMNKRKTLKNNLKNYDWNTIAPILHTLNYPENVRAEEISEEDFIYISNKMC